MKRTSQIHKSGIRSGDLEKDITPEQFGLIGRVAIAYNEAEVLIQVIYGASFGVSTDLSSDFMSRTNGLDSTVLLAKAAIREFRHMPELHEEFSNSLDFFMEVKGYRDSVVHARMFHAPTGIGKGSLNKGKRSEIRLTREALQGLYDRLNCLRDELLWMVLVVISLHQIHMIYRFSPLQLDQRRKQIEPMILVALPQYRECRARRRSLAPLPTFPDLPEDQQGVDIKKEFSDMLDMIATDLGIADYHNPFRQD